MVARAVSSLLAAIFIVVHAASVAGAASLQIELEAPGPQAPLAGTLLQPDNYSGGAVVLILPGFGRIDRDGNDPLGARGATYRLLAQGLASQGIASVRVDKRGQFGSADAVAETSAVTIADYAGDARVWATFIVQVTGAKCVWLLGHAEGGLVALAATRTPVNLCGVILAAMPGRTPAIRSASLAEMATAALAKARPLEAAGSGVSGPGALSHAAVDGYAIDLAAYDSVSLIAECPLPILIIQGTRDLEVRPSDARLLRRVNARARLIMAKDANHMLKPVPSNSLVSNSFAAHDPNLPIAPGIIDAVAAFVRQPR